MDVHAETVAVAVAEPQGEVRSLGTIPNCAESIRKLIKKLGPADKLRACYAAGPPGYVVYWQLAELGVECEVILSPQRGPRSLPSIERFRTSSRYAERPAAAEFAFCVAAYTSGMDEARIEEALAYDYLSRDPSPSKRAAWIRRSMAKARGWIAQ